MEPLSNIPGGMRYYFGREARVRRAVEDAVMSVFDGWGYEEIATPSVDYYVLFERGMGREEARRSFRFTDTDGRLLALRPDVTSSVARAAATLFASAPRPLRFCYAASVFFQRPRSHAEWKRQGRQLGCELIGAPGGEADAEVLAIAAEVLERLRLRFRVTLNHVGVFKGVAEQFELNEAERERVRRLIDARDAAGLEVILAPHAGESASNLARSLTRPARGRDAIEEARSVLNNARSLEALDALEKTWGIVEALELSDVFDLDLGDVSGLDYYTGLVFKIYAEGAGSRVGSGGRYDELTANFGRGEPAVGFVLDLDAVSEILARASDFDAENGSRAQPDSIEGESTAERLREARRLRTLGERIKLKD
jgi:ATP phosphoribosyltransferase regulatory subunit